jgi:superoxide dismutase, Cu-Zn family
MRRTTGVLMSCLLAACAGSADTAKQDETAASPALDTAIAAATGDTVEDTTSVGDAPATARATMRDAQGQELGTLTVTQSADGLVVAGRLSGVAPGEHGLHVHMVGQCQPPFTTAGAHWNPANRQHGEQNPQGPHAGDLLNVTVPANGMVEFSVTTHGGSLGGDVALLDADGASVVMHAAADDYRTDPSGNSGDRIACAVVERG